MDTPAGRVLLTEAQIAARVRTLGEQINEYYSGRRPVFLGVMNGALFFLADLIRAVELETEILCLRLASYKGTQSTGTVRGLEDLRDSVRGREVLVVDDIFDTGQTLASLVARLKELGAAEVKICVMLEKRRAHVTPIRPDWLGFSIEDEFVVGYGLDYEGQYRQLRDIRVLAEEDVAQVDAQVEEGHAVAS